MFALGATIDHIHIKLETKTETEEIQKTWQTNYLTTPVFCQKQEKNVENNWIKQKTSRNMKVP